MVADYRTADYSLMREMNVALILECLRREAPLSRAQLASVTGLNKTTVSSLVKELISARYVREMGLAAGDKGRPSIKLELDPDAGLILGAEIGVDFVSAILTDFAAKVIWQRRDSTVGLTSQADILERALAVVRSACAEAELQRRAPHILGLALGVPGLVDISSGTLLYAPNLRWANVPLRRLLEAEFDLPVWVDNEANMAALGESYFGAARGADYVLYVSSGVGLGGGIVFNRRILKGASGFAGEVGHMTMDPAGPLCNCGNTGCWETYVSQWAVFQRVRQAVAGGQHSWLETATGGALNLLTIPLVVEAAQKDDVVARQAFEETGRYLGIGLANLINALNPQRVVLGGIMSLAQEFWLPRLKAVVRERALRWSREAAEIVMAAYGEQACLMGAIATVYHHVLAQPRQAAGRVTLARVPA